MMHAREYLKELKL